MNNQRIVVTKHGGPEVLKLVEEPTASPRPGEVRILVEASGVAFVDLLARRRRVPGHPKPPFTPGYDVVGTVEAVGPGVSNLNEGDRVAALMGKGGYAGRLCWPAAELIRVPARVDAAEAVAMVLNYVTAQQLLHRVARVRPGEQLLVHGAAGGVGSALVQLARLAGARVLGSASAAKLVLVQQLGAEPVDCAREDFVPHVRELTGGGADVVLDGVGGRNVGRSYRAARSRGRVVAYGLSGALDGGSLFVLTTLVRLAFMKVMPTNKRVRLYGIDALKKKMPCWFREDLELVLGRLANTELKPVIAARVPLAEAARAHALLESRAVSGKVVLVPS